MAMLSVKRALSSTSLVGSACVLLVDGAFERIVSLVIILVSVDQKERRHFRINKNKIAN